MKAKLLYAAMFLLVKVLLDYFQQYMLKYTKNFFPESDVLKWGASCMSVRSICRQIPVRDILTRDNSSRESWRQGHPDAKDILTPKAPNFCTLFFFFLFLLFAFPRYATATLLTINVRLLWRKYNIFRLLQTSYKSLFCRNNSKASCIFATQIVMKSKSS